ncbi:hypothetical protein [uncultured Paludibaculum sp.]|uniref:hypothetical protein n=1 Tax=uncultured Paludibaculum sp. TaxID=1765020 RepID=UPI002AAAE404|nr:hypothetical protein [uncultured Paludibaculum sp.]
MLWTDADFVTADDLTSMDNEVLAVAAAENIVLDGSSGNGVINRATEEAGDSLLKHMREFGGALYGDGSVSPNHYAAIMNTGSPQAVRSRVLLSQIVVSGPVQKRWTPLKRWVVYWALMMFYRDAANRTQNDRYADKANAYRIALHGSYWAAAREAGLPIVRNPLPCPGAVYEPESGIWGPGNVSVVSGAGTVSGPVDVAITYVDASRENGESYPSARVTVDLQPGTVLKVDISSLTPPTGKQPASTRAQAIVPYATATHWRVYAGESGGPLYQQEGLPLDIGTLSYTFTGDPLTGGVAAGTGQYPELYQAFQNWNQRG